ncbi:hypothetical protein CORT_0A00110 [Candida orthopsilosis Co 90-125]|uniref:Uncharacterized protein n=1 Tax=Candida orthopsilosis (strain 90-125) TaxID=1136231 RepID=H8WZ58_CANO9|nr:hypothetical protein CORT_0A00110 [Candida orthopsilosis Co 90-125]CCG20405.1 hypothetical protein CORT_0A00110 [Candida orthopsilosis Co 90-125]
MQLQINFFPHYILLDIISKAGIESLVKLLSPPSFLRSNLNIKEAIDHAIRKKMNWTYDNIATKTDKMFSWKSCNEVGTTDFKNFAEIQTFHDYCVGEYIEVELKLCYRLKYASDLIELEHLLLRLDPRTTLKLHLVLDLVSCRFHFVDLTHLSQSFKHLRDRFTGFSISATSMAGIKGEIDLNNFSNIEILRINGCTVKGSLSDCHKLREFSFEPVRGQDNLFDINELPPSLKRLEISNYSLSNSRLKEGKVLPSLEYVAVSCDEDPMPSPIMDVVQNMTCQKTTAFSYSYEFGLADQFMLALCQVAKDKSFNLKSLSIYGCVEAPIEIYPSEQLELRYVDNSYLASFLKSLPTVKKLTITENVVTELGGILNNLPDGLEYLSLFDNKKTCVNANVGFARLQNLKCLNLSRTGIRSIIEFTFPSSLEVLDLSGNEIDSIVGVVFPKSLKSLDLSFNDLQDLQGARFPQSLMQLNMFGNSVEIESILKKVETLQIETLYLGNNEECKFSSCTLPASIRSLSLNCCSPSNCNFGETLVSLRMESCNLTKGISFGTYSRLRYLCINFSKLTAFDIELPQSLEELDLSHNELSEIPSHLGLLSNMRYLSFRNNEISFAFMGFSQSSLEMLDLSNNKIKNVRLSFPKGATKLKQLDLCENQLDEVSLKSIGHDGRTFHDCLYELSLAGNTDLGEDQVMALVPGLPQSAQSLWADRLISHPPCAKYRAVNYLSKMSSNE